MARDIGGKMTSTDIYQLYTDLRVKYAELLKFYDNQVGTPCEQIRHKQEIVELTQQYLNVCNRLNECNNKLTNAENIIKILREEIQYLENNRGSYGPTS